MSLDEWMDENTWRIDENEETRELDRPDDAYEYMDIEDGDYLLESWLEDYEPDEADSKAYRKANPDIKEEALAKIKEKRAEHKASGSEESFRDWMDADGYGRNVHGLMIVDFEDVIKDWLESQGAYGLYDSHEAFKEHIDSKLKDYLDENEYAGFLKSWDVYEACYEATYDSDWEDYLEEHKDEHLAEFKQAILDLHEEYLEEVEESERAENRFWQYLDEQGFERDFDAWFKENKEDEARDECQEYRSDGIMPMWLNAWPINSHYSVSELNELCRQVHVWEMPNTGGYYNQKFITIAGCGMDLSPAIYYAFMKYGGFTDEATIKEMLCKFQRSGIQYIEYVIGKEQTLKLMQIVGEEIAQRMDARGREEYKKFDESIKNLTKARDEDGMDSLLTGLGAMMAYSETQKCRVDEEQGQPGTPDSVC